MFSHTIMKDQLARDMKTDLFDSQIEIKLRDASTLPLYGINNYEPGHCVLPHQYLEYADRIHNLTVYKDDVWVITFPKCGTTCIQEMVWLITNDLDYEDSNFDLNFRSVFLEASSVFGDCVGNTVENVENLPGPRHIISHLPMSLLPKQLWIVQPKIIYCARNPKDVAASYWHHYRHLYGYKGTKETFLEGLLAEKALWCPQIPHTLDFWMLRHTDYVLFNQYEEMAKDMMSVLRKTSRFLGKSYTDQQLETLAQHLSFDNMKKNTSINQTQLIKILEEDRNITINFEFLRKGQVGGYEDELNPEYVKRFNAHIDQQLTGSGFKYME